MPWGVRGEAETVRRPDGETVRRVRGLLTTGSRQATAARMVGTAGIRPAGGRLRARTLRAGAA